jgi:nucleotide-binding universal stress UspA family protein
MVHLDLGTSNAAILAVTADLAARFGARVIGIVACQPMMMAFSDGYMSADVIEEDRASLEKQCLTAETEFRAALHGKVSNLLWRSSVSYDVSSDVIAAEMRSADLLLIAPPPSGGHAKATRRVDLGDLIMQLGRPMLMVPPSISTLNLDQIVIGWKNTRETRRAVWDSLPLLRKAHQVTVAQIGEADDMEAIEEGLRDVTAWLAGHGVTAEKMAIQSRDNPSQRLDVLATDRRAQILVTGAYGHNRLREWVLGGVTRDLLLHPPRCAFVSH